ncbi:MULTISPECIES: amidase [Pseudomonas]|uniref:amidase n=1 Tax=Pseudomonas TaxID=286 RepID=UPI0002173EAF|nr:MULTISPECIES: amidase family protein [Pseudomonas]AEJ13911.1 putative amidase [Pseudomonas putida S16]WOB57051.1 amidase family protein [Pseudomonas sp. NBB]
MSYPFKSALELRDAIVSKEVSPVEVVTASIDRMQSLEPLLNAFVTQTPELALSAARAAEKAVMRGERFGALHGLPISVKDLISVSGVRQTFGSRVMSENVATSDAPSVERIKAAGACIIGITTTSEFGCKAVGDSPMTGITRNPWNLEKTPGGSSCGAAASVAAGVTPFALGTDGGGSIRTPASFTGLVGVKAQFARVPVFPTSATPTLAHVGPLARTVRDSALLLGVLSGFDRRDPYSLAGNIPDYLAACDVPVKGMKVAWSPTLGIAQPDSEVLAVTERAVRILERLGCEVIELEEGIGSDPAEIWLSEFYAGISTRLAGAMRDSRDLLDPALAKVLEKAMAQSLPSYYEKVFARYAFREKVSKTFESFDLLLSPVVPIAACDVGVNVPAQFGDRSICTWQYYTYPFNVTGQPAASVPAGFTKSGLPIGLQMVAKVNREVDIFRAAAALENDQKLWEIVPSQFSK